MDCVTKVLKNFHIRKIFRHSFLISIRNLYLCKIIKMMNMDFSINVGGRLLSLESPLVVGILNCTPDSFFSGSRKQTEREIAERAQQIVSEGGRMIDVGAFSTRPGADEVPIEEELRRLQTALQILRREVPDAIVSVDTYRPLVARRCVEEWGADIVNDVSEGGRTGIVGVAIHEEESMFATVAQLGVPYILMSVQPTIETMLKTWADDVLQLRSLGQKDIILDPGFGFGKTLDENYAVMGELEKLAVMELPLLVGVSRKSMIWKLLDGTPDTALNGTTTLNAIALLKGAKILRVHDVKEAVETIEIVKRLKG